MKPLLIYIKKHMLPVATVALCIAVAMSVSAFKNKPKKATEKFTTYWYTYTGADQSVANRKLKTNYTSPSTSAPSCPTGSNNECAVEVTGITGTPPSDISTLDVTFNSSTGFPQGGDNYDGNALKN